MLSYDVGVRFVSPIWLAALAPWALVAVWMLRRRAQRAYVPFTRLWDVPAGVQSRQRGTRRPPLFALLLLAAMLLGIVAAGRPVLVRPQRMEGGLIIVVDRGVTMSAAEGGVLRFDKLAEEAQAVLGKRLRPDQEVTLILLPGESPIHTDVRGWLGHVEAADPTGVDTRTMLDQAVGELGEEGGLVVVLSDQRAARSYENVIEVSPNDSTSLATIVAVAARSTPYPQVMVRVRNQSALRHAWLEVESGDAKRRVEINLPPPRQESNVFLDLASPGPMISVQLEAGSAVSPAGRAYLARENRAARVAAGPQVGPALKRLIDVYNQAQPPADEALEVAATVDPRRQVEGQPAVVIASGTLKAAGSVTVRPSAVTDHVRWEDVLSNAVLAAPAEGQWQTLVGVGGRPAVMMQAGPPRRLWVGITSEDWEKSADYVIFWKNAFDWLGGGQGAYTARRAGALGAPWRGEQAAHPSLAAGLWPGIYRNGRGGVLAVNAADVPLPEVTRSQWRGQLARVLETQSGGGDLSRWMFLAAAICVGAAACVRLR